MQIKYSVKSLIIGSVVVLALLFLLIARPKAPLAPIKEQVWHVQVQTVEKQAYAPTLELYGAIESPQAANLESGVAAYVAKTPIAEGEKVTKGQLLIALDDRDAKILVAQRQAEVE